MPPADIGRRAAAEGIGTALLLAVVVGSGIMAERLSGGNAALALLANAIATGGGLVAILLMFGSISGAHFNPVVTLADAVRGDTAWRDVPAYVAAQMVGAYVGVALAHTMFDLPLFSPSTHARTGSGQWVAEIVATFGLLATIWGASRKRPETVPFAVACYVTAGYWFTSSTSFANPAVALARAATDTFAGIRPAEVPGFIAAELAGGALALAVFRWLAPVERRAPAVTGQNRTEDAA